MWDWLDKYLDRCMQIGMIVLAIIVLVGMGMAMYNLQAYYGKDNICKEGRW